MNLPASHAAALEWTRRTVNGIGADQWSLPTPCAGWDVRFLLNHVVAGNEWVHELVGGRTIEEVGDRLDGDRLGADPAGAYAASAVLADEAFSTPGAMEEPCAVSYGPVPGEVYCGHRLIDVLVHGWDLAKATSQDASLPEDLCRTCLDVIEPQRDVLIGSGMFGAPVPCSSDDPRTVLLTTLGRR
ncbi:MAG: TIGR03086 family metal-binding protein [Acidimicrobiia bacterium]